MILKMNSKHVFFHFLISQMANLNSWTGLTAQAVEYERNAQRRDSFAWKTDEDLKYISQQYMLASQFWNQADVPEYVQRCLQLSKDVLKKQTADDENQEVKLELPPLPPRQSRIMDYFQHEQQSMQYFQRNTYQERQRHRKSSLQHHQRQFEVEREKWMRRAHKHVYEELEENADDRLLTEWM